ncbi:acyl-CoA dehydrogenase family protein [Gordonia sinesedis]
MSEEDVVDFAPDATAAAVADAAEEVFVRHRPDWTDRFGAKPGFDAPLWRAIADAGLTALPLPTVHDGDDVDAGAILPLLRRMGRSAAVTPALGALTSALTLRHADPDAAADGPRARWTASLTGAGWHAVALGEPGEALTATPQTTVRDGRLTGVKTGVLHADGAGALIVAADAGAVLVRPDAPGVSMERTPTSSGWAEYTVRFAGVEVDEADILTGERDFLRDVYRLVLCAYADGLVAGATRLTADHVSNRNQFGKPIALFQAVGQQLADVYVTARALDLATTAAGWRLSEGLDASEDLGIGTYWLAAEIPATLRTMTHLHGGVGVDITYPLHRYFSVAKDLARLAGGSHARLDELADRADSADHAASDTDTSRELMAGVR